LFIAVLAIIATAGAVLLPFVVRTHRAGATGGAAPTITITPAPSTPGSPNPNPNPAPVETDVEFKFIVNLTGSPLASGELVFSSTGTITDVMLPPEWER
jgi:hypothetical protein